MNLILELIADLYGQVRALAEENKKLKDEIVRLRSEERVATVREFREE